MKQGEEGSGGGGGGRTVTLCPDSLERPLKWVV